MTWDEVSADSPAKKWLTDGDTSNDRNVLQQDGSWYYNPSSEAVKQMVVGCVTEVLKKYDIRLNKSMIQV